MKKTITAVSLAAIATYGILWQQDTFNTSDVSDSSASPAHSNQKAQKTTLEIPVVLQDQPANNAAQEVDPAQAEVSPQQMQMQRHLKKNRVIGYSERHTIVKLLSETWLTPKDQRDRRRVRVVKTKFKHPFLRLEEIVSTDPATGEQSIRTVKNSVADHLSFGLPKGMDPEIAAQKLTSQGFIIRDIGKRHLLVEIEDYTQADAHNKAIAHISKHAAIRPRFIESDNIRYRQVLPNDPDFQNNWGLNNTGQETPSPDSQSGITQGSLGVDIEADEGWDVRTDASDVIVAVVDSGINYDHEDLAANMWTNQEGAFGINRVEMNNDPDDDDGHGTHVAGTIGAVGNNGVGTSGVAWSVQLMACRGLGPQGGTDADLAACIDFARENGAHVINASYGGPGFSQVHFDAIEAASEAGIIFCAASGNDSIDNDVFPSYPCNFEIPNVISVASTDNDDALSVFSNFGRSSVDIGAPGTDIYSTWIDDNDPATPAGTNYNTISGTSMATPHIAGAMALARAEFPEATMEDLILLLYCAAEPIESLVSITSQESRLNLNNLLNGVAEVTNDDFDSALTWDGRYELWAGCTLEATRESDEDSFSVPNTGENSVWFKWTAPETGWTLLNVEGQTGATTRFVIFRGQSKDNLSVLYDSGAVATTAPKYSFSQAFPTKQNEEFTILLDSDATTEDFGTFRSRIELIAPTLNNNIATATEVSGENFSVNSSNVNATSQYFETTDKRFPGETHGDIGSGYSIWFEWQAPFTGDMTFTVAGQDEDTGIALDLVTSVYSGNPLTAGNGQAQWTTVSDPDSTLSVQTVPVVAGTTYYIAVDSIDDNTGDIIFAGAKVEAIALEAWKASNFSAAQLLDEAISGDTADPDDDGLTNLEEYIHGSDPNDRESTPLSNAEATRTTLNYTYTRAAGTTDGSVGTEASRNLSTWSSDNITEKLIKSENGIETIKASIDLKAGEQGFIRLKYGN